MNTTERLLDLMNEVKESLNDSETEKGIHPMMDISHKPALNMIDAEVFQKRVAEIFELTADSLKKSYGPYGSSAILENYPFHHVTKDGFSIMKRLSFSKEFTLVDDSIRELISAPCTRLNFAVGDGTTTAIIAVNAIYNSFIKQADLFKDMDVPPRDILKAYNRVRDLIVSHLEEITTPVNRTSHEDMVDTIGKIAYISSNGDDEITELVKDMYDELDYPLINVENASDAITKKTVIKGYHFDGVIKDVMYVNDDNRVGNYKDLDLLLFDHKITMDTFMNIIFPLNEECRKHGRHLCIIAPAYDDVAMLTVSRKLLGEYQQMHDVNLILMAGRIATPMARSMYEDLAMLLNTTIINRSLVEEIRGALKVEKDEEGNIKRSLSITNMIDINNRDIPGILIDVVDANGVIKWTEDRGTTPDDMRFPIEDNAIRCGFAGSCTLGFDEKKGSIFNDLHYDQGSYDKTYNEVRFQLDESIRKGEKLGVINLQADQLQSRLFRLGMKIGTLEVGGNSNLSMEMLRDTVDDTVKATSSAYFNGIVPGCSVGTLCAIWSLIKSEYDNLNAPEKILLDTVFDGFVNVYKTLLSSRYQNGPFYVANTPGNWSLKEMIGTHMASVRAAIMDMEYHSDDEYILFGRYYLTQDDLILIQTNMDLVMRLSNVRKHPEAENTTQYGLFEYDIIIALSMLKNEAFDLTTTSFNPNIINSARTDKEVLIASSDLISLLITGNQFIMAGE